MNLRELARGEPWMTEEEQRLNRRFVRGMRALFEEHGVGDSPLLALRVGDVAVSYVLVRRLEALLDGNEGETPDAVVEKVSRARERMRKAMKELEEACAKQGTPIDTGLADLMKPLLVKAKGLEEEAAARRASQQAGTEPGTGG